jgi:hypothetical protein
MNEIKDLSEKVVYIVVEDRICTKFNESVKMKFTSKFESENAPNSINQSKYCLYRGWIANMHKIQWASQNEVYIVVE